jgi:RNA polymerase-binding transcription factor DksA
MLDQQTLNELRNQLEMEKHKLEKELGKIAKVHDGDLQGSYKDVGNEPDDEVNEFETFATDTQVTEDLERRLEEVNAALEKMDKGTYGFSEDNPSEALSVEQLRANPAAKRPAK